ncbi:hypothetical protein OAP55_00430 [Alphaproteobacteria bacterium]|nr:hypothetical protein [Alphaproteobacteria bacterium]
MKMGHNIHKFSISKYKLLLKTLKGYDVKFKKYNDNLNSGKNILLRHDVDFCPLRALEIAKLEKELKVTSTYFFLINTNFYNIHSLENTKAVLEILKLGHEVGLHFDASLFSSNKSLNSECKKEIEVLEKVIGRKIYIVSFHRPAKNLLSYEKKIANIEHTYMSKYFKKIDYCSDSQGEWRYNTPLSIIKKKTPDDFTLHLLTHPIWWTTPEQLTAAEKVDFHLKRKNYIYAELAAYNCKPYAVYLSNLQNSKAKL